MKVLLTAFRRSSAELLLKNTDNSEILLLPNDKIKDSELLINAILDNDYDLVISLGQRPNIKNKVHIETTAKLGVQSIDTEFDCDRLIFLCEKNGITAKISHNAGTSFCNQLYFNVLRYITNNRLKTKMVFVHIPFLKNIEDFESFRIKLFEIIKSVEDI